MASDPYAPENFEFNPYAATRANSSHAHSTPAELKHAGVGIASFILSVISGLMLLVLVVIAGVMEASSPGGMDEESVEAMAVGLALLGFMLGSFIAVVLGFVGIFQSNRKKLFAILGILFGGLTLFGVLGLIAIGLTME